MGCPALFSEHDIRLYRLRFDKGSRQREKSGWRQGSKGKTMQANWFAATGLISCAKRTLEKACLEVGFEGGIPSCTLREAVPVIGSSEGRRAASLKRSWEGGGGGLKILGKNRTGRVMREKGQQCHGGL